MRSEIMETRKKIIRVVSVIIIPVGGLLFWGQMRLPDNSFNDAVVQTVAALLGMIPEGLMLLTSTVLAVSVIRLSSHKVLVQDCLLYTSDPQPVCHLSGSLSGQ